MNRTLLIGAMAVGLAVVPSSFASAQTAPAQRSAVPASPAVQAPVREVYPHELMTFSERFDMWRKMRAARSVDEKMELWADKHAELEKRAAERGVVLRDRGPMMMDHHGQMTADRDDHQGRSRMGSGGESRMGMMGMGGSGQHRPPMGW